MSTANHKTTQQHVITCTVHALYNHIACSCITINLRNIPFSLSMCVVCIYSTCGCCIVCSMSETLLHLLLSMLLSIILSSR